jgi:glycine/D-amino acid oxidase-like deaminating enzyme
MNAIGSYWEASAAPGPALPPLTGERETEVAIVGAGLTGLAVAEALQERGVSCLVLDAKPVGWGASGRNGGSATPRYKKGWAALAAAHGDAATLWLHRALHAALDGIEARVERHGIACDFRRAGQATTAHGPAALAGLVADIDWLRRVARDETPRLLDREQTMAMLGTGEYPGAFFDPRGGFLHPLSYVRGWARALAGLGVAIHPESEVVRCSETASGVTLETTAGRVRARNVVLATNAYTPSGIFPGALERRIVPVASSLIVTAPLSGNLAAGVLPHGAVLADTRRILNYACKLPDGRLMIGGRGDLTGAREDPASYRRLERTVTRLFPALDGTAIDYRWKGMVAVTLDALPHVGSLSPRIHYGLGYGGRGLVPAHIIGRMLARRALGETVDAGPFGDGAFKPIPMHGLRRPAMRLAAGWWEFLDRREARRK